MSVGAPWSVKGIDPKAREIAKDLARRSGMTLGEWLNQVILEDEAPLEEAPRYPTFGRQPPPSARRYDSGLRPVEEAFRVSDTLDRLSARIEAADQRAAAAIGGIEQSVAHLMARMEGTLQDQKTTLARVEGAVDGLRAEQVRGAERLRRLEQDVAETGTGEALKTLESALAKLAGQMCDGEGQSRRIFDGLRQELDGVHEQLDTAFTEGAARELVESVIARLSGRLEQAELHTAEALRTLEVAFDEVDARVKTAEARLEDRGDDDRLEALAARLTERIDAVRAEMAETIRASAADDRIGQIEQTLEDVTGQVRAVEQRSAGAIDKIGHEVLRMADTVARKVDESERRSTAAIANVRGEVVQQLADADRRVAEVSGEVARVADTFARGLEDSERRSTEAIERIGGDIARVAGVVEQRLAHADAIGAQALERLGGEIARITERLTERVANAERRSAQAIDDVGDHVARATERLQDRQERISTELSERIRLSEERTARFLDEARERIDQRLSETQRRSVDTAPAPQAEPVGFSAYADPAVAPFGADSFTSPAVEAPRGFADAGTAELDDADALTVPAAPATTGDSELFAQAEAEADPFDEVDDFVDPAHPKTGSDDFGAGLFAEPQRHAAELDVEDDDDWLSPSLDTDPRHDERAGPFGLAALARDEDDHAHLEPDADEAFDAHDDYVEPAPERPKTTRELIEQARAAARSASPALDAKLRAGEKSGGSLFGGFGLGGKAKKKQRGGTMRTALLVSGATAALGVALAGYVILSATPHGALPERVAAALGVHSPAPTHPAAGEVASNPLAAVALAPKPIAGQVANAAQPTAQIAVDAAGGAELYNDAVRRIEAKDKTGVAPLLKAANLGYAPAQFYLAKLYEDGQAGLPKDLVEARRWTERAAEGGDRKAMHNLALYFFEGAGGPKNLTSAAQWFRRAADLGLVDSQYNLARLYEEGFGVSENAAEAYKWYLIAGRSGDAESRLSALRIKSQLSAEAQSAAERAAQGYQPQAPQPIGASAQAAAGVAVAQRALTKLGFYQGPTDGVASPALKLAIAAYQRGQGLPATGQIDSGLDQRLATVLQ